MMPSESTGPLGLRLVLSSAAMAVATVGAVVFALLGLPQILVVGLSLVAAAALIDVAGILSARHELGLHRPVATDHRNPVVRRPGT
jgi:hypothetical protein